MVVTRNHPALSGMFHHSQPSRAPKGTVIGPANSVRSLGCPSFRTQLVRDITCLLDVDRDVLSWRCPASEIGQGAPGGFRADITVNHIDGVEWIMAADEPAKPMPDATAAPFRVLAASDVAGPRLDNAKALLRYANWHAPLGDRVRLLAMLERERALSLVDCMAALIESREPIATIAWMVLHRLVDMEIDAPIGPGTLVIDVTR